MSEENLAGAPEQPEQTDFAAYEALSDADRDAAVETASAEGAAAAGEPAKPAEAKPAKPEVKPDAAKPVEAGKPAAEEEDPEVPHGLRKRFRELTSKIRELEARPAAPVPPAAAAPAAVVPAGDAEPVKPDLATWPGTYAEYEVKHEQYLKDMVRFEAKQVAGEAQRATELAARDVQLKEAKAKWDEQQEAARDEHDDFDEVALNKSLPVTQIMFDQMRESPEHCTALLYHLGEDFAKGGDMSAKIAALSPHGQARAIARLEAKLFPDDEGTPAAAAEVKPAISRAPKPPKLVSGVGVADLGKEPDPKDFKAWSKWKDKQERSEAEAA